MRQRGEAHLWVCLCLLCDLIQLCGHSSPTSECAGNVSLDQQLNLPRRFPMYAAFPRSEYYQRVRLPPSCLSPSGFAHSVAILGLKQLDQDGGGSPSCLDASVSAYAVLLDPRRSLQRPSPLRSPTVAFQVFDPVGLRMCHEAQSLHLRYGLGIALSTLSPCRYLHEPKTRFLVERLVPLARTGISPAGNARLSLAHRKSHGCQHPECSSLSS